jgi:hypothetical protein
MSILVQCEKCSRQLRVPETAAGKKVRCPVCHSVFSAQPVPSAVPSAPAPPASIPSGLAMPLQQARPVPPSAPTPVMPESSALKLGIQETPAPRPVRAVSPLPETEAPRPVLPVKRRSFSPLRFPVMVTADPDKKLKGRLEAQINSDGLTLWQGKNEAAHAPVGTSCRYLGKNRFVLTLDDREVTLAAIPPRKYQHRLARDVVAFLREEKSSLREADYNMPVALYLAAGAPLSVAIVAIIFRIATQSPAWASAGIWGGIWGGVGGGLAGAAFAMVQREKWPMAGRVVLSLGMTAVGYTALVLTLVISAVAGGPHIDAGAWKEFSPPGGRFRIEMPGKPEFKNLPAVAGVPLRMWMVELKSPNSAFAVEYGDIPPGQLNLIPVEQRFMGARQGMLANTPNSEVVSEKALTLKGHPGREFVLRIRGHGQMIVHTYLVGNRFFVLLAGGDRFGPNSPDVQKFLNSFQLQEAAPPPGVRKVPPQRGAVPSAKDIPGLLAYWPLDEGNGVNAKDASGTTNNATVVGAAQWQDGVRGKALTFSGRGDYLDLGKSPALNFPANGPFTITGWVRTLSSGPLVSMRRKRMGAAVIDLTIEGGRITAVVRADGQEFGEARVVGGLGLSDGAWHHFALTRDVGGRIELFVDGNSQGQGHGGNSAGAITTDLRASGAELYWVQGGLRMGQPYLAGSVDELAIFNRVLTPDEVRRLAGR